ncbi:Tetratricopeptide repeat-containing protein [Pontibaca methylaminivorans]|uniref:Tetratricopeptide repeat-containing protein n=2 Tax=Pontibaca methylaminivorans TaxID=515897 RepID=A0A1R3WGI8_9RHOB|nr:Tetratricopeptide repeat-containing protein [Pontibaca methylaminivorans]
MPNPLETTACGVTLGTDMSTKGPNIKLILAALAAIVMFSPPSGLAQPAQGGADAADEAALLAELAEADAERAPQIEARLQAIWSRSGSPAMDLLLERGRRALETGDAGAALDHLGALTDHAPDFAEGWHLRASAWFEAGRFGPALSDLERALALNPSNYRAIYGLGMILEELGDKAPALRAYRRAQAIAPQDAHIAAAVRRLQQAVGSREL